MSGHVDTTLVTGFPSFRGRKMVEALLAGNPDRLVHAIVHKKFADQAKAFCRDLGSADRDRFVVWEGDAAAIDLGLSGTEYRDLASRVERIHHVAQVTYPGVSRKVAESVNIGATQEIVELGRVCERLKCIV